MNESTPTDLRRHRELVEALELINYQVGLMVSLVTQIAESFQTDPSTKEGNA